MSGILWVKGAWQGTWAQWGLHCEQTDAMCDVRSYVSCPVGWYCLSGALTVPTRPAVCLFLRLDFVTHRALVA
jgi:hypothetical protein